MSVIIMAYISAFPECPAPSPGAEVRGGEKTRKALEGRQWIRIMARGLDGYRRLLRDHDSKTVHSHAGLAGKTSYIDMGIDGTHKL